MNIQRNYGQRRILIKRRSRLVKRIDWQNRLLYILVMVWVARNTILVRRRSGDLYTAVDAMALLQIGVVGLILMILASGLFRRSLKYVISNTSLRFYFLYYILGLFSALWSVNPAFSLYRAMEVIALSMAVLVFCTSASNLEENVQRTRIMIWSVVLLSVFASAGRMSIWYLRDNTLGAAVAMTACFFVAWIISGRYVKTPKLLIQSSLGVLLTVTSMSLASWWSFWFGICYCALLTKRKVLVVVLVVLGVSIFFSLGADTRKELLIRDKTHEQIENLHGRRMLWESYMAASSERPLLGFGFAIGGREIGKYSTNTHNSFYGALLGVGWVGVMCWVLFFGTLAWELFRYRHFRNPVWLACAAAIAAGLLNSMSLSILAEQWSVATTVFVAFLGLHLTFLREAKAGQSHSSGAETNNPFSRRHHVAKW